MGYIYGKDIATNSADFSCPCWTYIFVDLPMGDTTNHHFYDFGICEAPPEKKTKKTICLSLETPGYLSKKRESQWNVL